MKNKYLIVHADDFGLSPGISHGILKSIREGIVSSTSVIVKSKYLSNSKKIILDNLNIDWGLHVLIDCCTNPSYQIILRESLNQIKIFKKSFGFLPSHIDFHKGFKFDKRTYFEILMLSTKFDFAFRYDQKHHVETKFYGFENKKITYNSIETNSILSIIKIIPYGFTELICHPGTTSNHLKDPYRLQRAKELSTLIDPKVRLALEKNKIKLINFKEYKEMIKKNDN